MFLMKMKVKKIQEKFISLTTTCTHASKMIILKLMQKKGQFHLVLVKERDQQASLWMMNGT